MEHVSKDLKIKCPMQKNPNADKTETETNVDGDWAYDFHLVKKMDTDIFELTLED